MLECQRDFTEYSPYKDSIERDLFASCRMVSHVDGVTGPAIERHIRSYRDLVAFSSKAQIRIIELDEDVHKQQIEWKALPDSITGPSHTWNVRAQADDNIWPEIIGQEHLKSKVALVRANITDIQNPARFFDADLMGNATGITGQAINTVLNRQATLYSSDKDREFKKALVFTFSIRPAGEAVTLEWIEDLLGRNLNSIFSFGGKSLYTKGRATGINTTGYKGTSVHLYNNEKFIKRGRIEGLKVFYYNEGNHPMITGAVVYR